MKVFTNLEQCKKLAKILPLKSADAHWKLGVIESFVIGDNGEFRAYPSVPAWTLAALLGVLPNNKVKTTTMSKGGWLLDPIDYIDKWFVEYEDEEHTNDFHVSADEPVDACVEMIEKLSKEGLL